MRVLKPRFRPLIGFRFFNLIPLPGEENYWITVFDVKKLNFPVFYLKYSISFIYSLRKVSVSSLFNYFPGEVTSQNNWIPCNEGVSKGEKDFKNIRIGRQVET